MNVPFTLANAELDMPSSLKGAKAAGLSRPRRSPLGRRHARASIYNAMTLDGVRRAGRLHEGIRAHQGLSATAPDIQRIKPA